MYCLSLLGLDQNRIHKTMQMTPSRKNSKSFFLWHHSFSYLYTQTELAHHEILFFSASIIYYLKRLEVNLNAWCINSRNVLSALINLSVQEDLLYFYKNKMAALLSTQIEWIISTITMASVTTWYSPKL